MEEKQSLFSLTIDPLTKSLLNDVAKWARILTILAMAILIVALIFTILNSTVLNNSMYMNFTVNGQVKEEVTNSMRVGMVIGAIIMTGIAFIPLYFLLQFSGRMKQALSANDQEILNDSFYNLKKYFRFLAIIVIIIIALYLLLFLFAILGDSIKR